MFASIPAGADGKNHKEKMSDTFDKLASDGPNFALVTRHSSLATSNL